MDAYAPLLARTRLPQPSLQRFAVTQIFDKLRSPPADLGPDSDLARESITLCLHSSSPAVVDQSVRELCKLVNCSSLDLSRALLELQSALEGSDPRFVDVFVKGIGFLVRFGFQQEQCSGIRWEFDRHPFVKICGIHMDLRLDISRNTGCCQIHSVIMSCCLLSKYSFTRDSSLTAEVLLCGTEVQNELTRQVALFIVQSKQFGMVEACTFLKPLLDFSVLRIPFSDSSSASFLRLLVSSLTSLCCSFPSETMPIFNLLICTLRYFQCKSDEDFKNLCSLLEFLVDSHVVVLRNLVRMGLAVKEAQLSGVKLLETLLSPCSSFEKPYVSEPIFELSRCLLCAQKELGLPYLEELSSPVFSLFVILNRLELEHEQLSMLKLLALLFNWRIKDGDGPARDMPEMLLFIFPFINLMSSTSKSVKGAAADLLLMLEELPVKVLATQRAENIINGGSQFASTPEMIVPRLLQCLWLKELSSSSLFSNIAFNGNNAVKIKHMEAGTISWISQLGELALCTVEKQKKPVSSIPSYESILAESPLLLSALVGSLLLHQSFATFAVDTLASFGTVEPKLGFTLLLCILYYNNYLRHNSLGCPDVLLKLMTMLPSLASHNAMMPIVIQTMMPMLQKNGDLVLYATAIRLMCKTWEINDRAFGSLEGILLPERFSEFASERTICISMAASLRDVCRKNPDRGVDLILSVSACIESFDPVIQVLGFHSLGHLCEADVVDFYTAWVVISKNVLDYTADPLVACGLCSLLRWGAMDAEAYPESSKSIMQMLWTVANFGHSNVDIMWAKARKSAFEALYHFELVQIEDAIEDYKRRIFELLVSESDLDVLSTIEQIEDKIIAHEHKNRRRLVKKKRVPANKIEKLLDVVPQAISSSVKMSIAHELPGAALLCLSFVPKEVDQRGQSKSEVDVVAQYADAMKEIVASHHLSRNIILAILSLESWKPFMRRWLKAYVTFLELKASSAVLDKTLKAANDILKNMLKIAEDSIPRSAENVGLALGAFCTVLPTSAHAVKVAVLKFLLNWLYQPEHEYRQWSAAVSIGLISSTLHITDHKQKLQNIDALIEVAWDSKSSLVKGACGVGLGFASQDLLSRGAAAGSLSDEEPSSGQEMNLIGKTVRTLSLMICQLTQSSSDLLQKLCEYYPPGLEDMNKDMPAKLVQDETDADMWGVVGLIMGLGSVVSVLYRAGSYETVHNIKSLLTSWVSCAKYLAQMSKDFDALLSVGACLALPAVISFCWKVELMHADELDCLVDNYKQLVSTLLSGKVSTALHQSQLMASCVGAGNLLACILSEGVHALEVECVKELLLLFKKAYSSTYPHIIHFGGMLGVVNAMGASAGTLVNLRCSKTSFLEYERKESSYIMGSLLSSLSFEPLLSSMMQDIFLVAQNSDDHQLQQYASWAASLLRHSLHSRELQNYDGNCKNDSSKPTSQSFPEDSAVRKLSLWLINLDHSVTAGSLHVNTAATVLRCLSRAPRLPTLDWLAVVKGCMRYGAQVVELQSAASVSDGGVLREECLRFSLAHADKFDPLLCFLDELSDLARFRTLDQNSQCCILSHLLDLLRVFSSHRIGELFNDLSEYFSSSFSSYQNYNTDQKSLVRLSCWKGLDSCLDETLLETSEYISSMENCMEVLFLALPELSTTLGREKASSAEEWMQSVQCLGKGRPAWLLDILKISEVDLAERNKCFLIAEKKIRVRAQLVKHGFLPLTELGKLKVCLFSAESSGLWDAIVEIVATLQHAEGSVKRQWLLDALEISCIAKHPATALQFVALLSGSCCKYMPLLVLDPSNVLHDLPVSLSSVLHENWVGIAESAASYLWTSTERLYEWAMSLADPSATRPAGVHPIAESENEGAHLLVNVLIETCISLKDLLPFEKQLRLASMLPL